MTVSILDTIQESRTWWAHQGSNVFSQEFVNGTLNGLEMAMGIVNRHEWQKADERGNMPYTIADWIRTNAVVCVKLPLIKKGEVTGNEFVSMQEAWIPLAVLLSEHDDSLPAWYDIRTFGGNEARDYQRYSGEETGE